MQKNTPLAIRVGIFLTLGLILIIGYSLQVSRKGAVGRLYQVTALFDDASGLDIGADVSLRGVRIGRVDKMDFDRESGRVRVTLELEERFPLPKDSRATVTSSAFLGNALVAVKYGKAKDSIAPGGILETDPSTTIAMMMENVSTASSEARDMFKSFNGNQGDILKKLREVIDENREDIRNASKSLAEAGPQLKDLSSRLNELTADVQAGKGTMGKLFKDEELYNSVKTFTQDAKGITDDIKNGNGTLSRLIYDDEIAEQARSAFDNLGKAGDEVQKALGDNKEQLRKVIDSLADVGPQMKTTFANVEAISKKLNEGNGTMGKMLNDPALYNDAKRAMNQVAESFEGSEEQGVIRSFFGLVFGAII